MEEEIATYLGAKGYSIKKDNISIPEQELIRKELTVKAFAPKSSISQPTPFPVYRESPKKFYVPRFYGYKTYGEPDEIRISEGENIEVPFAGELRDFQKPIVMRFWDNTYHAGKYVSIVEQDFQQSPYLIKCTIWWASKYITTRLRLNSLHNTM